MFYKYKTLLDIFIYNVGHQRSKCKNKWTEAAVKLKIGALSQKIAISAKKIETDQSSRAQMIA